MAAFLKSSHDVFFDAYPVETQCIVSLCFGGSQECPQTEFVKMKSDDAQNRNAAVPGMLIVVSE
jgi:hypothetical protein